MNLGIETSKPIILNSSAKLECSGSCKVFWFRFFLPHSPTGIAFFDSFKLQVYHNLCILRHQVFKDTAKQGKGTMGWFHSFKLYLIIKDQSDIISVKVTTANVDDRKPAPETIYY
ncbi:transposase [Candidatus Enterovibrio escicola]|nr:transposase [Candidatus Enterovibrio escacola]